MNGNGRPWFDLYIRDRASTKWAQTTPNHKSTYLAAQ